MNTEVIRFAVDTDGIATLTIDYPGKSMNVIDQAFIDSLGACIDRVVSDSSIRGAIITSGKDAFVAGADLVTMENNLDAMADDPVDVLFDKYATLSRAVRRVETCGKPIVAAINGIAMGGGTDVALETAEAALLRNRVTGVADLISLSRATLGNVWQNVALALGLKVVFLGTTLFGVTTLWMAILADTGATVLVTANALRLLSWGRTPLAVARRTSAE